MVVMRKEFFSFSLEDRKSHPVESVYLKSMIMSCMFGAGVILVPSRVSTFEFKGYVGHILNCVVWDERRKYMINMILRSLKLSNFHCQNLHLKTFRGTTKVRNSGLGPDPDQSAKNGPE